MALIGYHISHEQFPPGELLDLAVKAEKAGFDFCLSSDHFHPWSSAQGQSGFAWSWLGAAMARTKMKFGVVNCPAYRYHPALIAQASATLDQMFPGRFWLCAGSGQALNESITGEKWPEKDERDQRLLESVEIIRALWTGMEITRKGLVTVEKAKLYTAPRRPIKVVGAALTAETAEWAAEWADGLITASQEIETLTGIVKAWRTNGGARKPMMLKVQLSYHKNKEKARAMAFEQWRTNMLGSNAQAELCTPQEFEKASASMTPADLDRSVIISDSTTEIVQRLREYIAMGFRELSLHNVNTDQAEFIKVIGKEVLPLVKKF